jgi:hypothetical protein
MRRILGLLLAGTLVTALALALPASARSAVSCRLVSDAGNDTVAGAQPAVVPTDEPSLDITSADVAGNATWITTAVSVRHLDVSDTSGVPAMGRWSVLFTAGDVSYLFHARVGQGGVFGQVDEVHYVDRSSNSWTETGNTGITPRVTLDRQRNQVRISVRRSALGISVTQRLTQLVAYTWHEHTAYTNGFKQPGGEYDMTDDASSNASYVVGTRSCVKPGS